jgi:hypothetical protein
MHLLIWLVPSLAADAFCTGVLGASFRVYGMRSHIYEATLEGLLYGPMFPIGVALPTRLLPVEIHMSSMAIMWDLLYFRS